MNVYDKDCEVADSDQTPLISNKEPTQKEDEDSIRTSSFFSGFLNIANTILGAGLLGLPYAFSKGGWIVGTLLLCLGASGSGFGLHLLVICAHKVGGARTSFNSVAQATLPQLAFMIDLAVAIKCFGVATSYLLIVGSAMSLVMVTVVGHGIWIDRRFWITVILFVLILPITFFRKLDALKFTSAIALLAVVYLTLLVVLFKAITPLGACDGISECVGDINIVNAPTSAFSVLSIFVFAYTCHQNIFSVYNETSAVHDRRVRETNRVIVASLSSALALYLLSGYCGYFTYGNNVKDDILDSFPAHKWFVTIAQVLIAVLVAFSYPLQCHPARNSITNLVNMFLGQIGKKSVNPMSNYLHVSITVAHVALSYAIALFVTDLGKVFAVIGATGSTTISYILPGLFYASMFRDNHSLSIGSIIKYYAACVQVLVGVFIMITSLTFTFYKP